MVWVSLNCISFCIAFFFKKKKAREREREDKDYVLRIVKFVCFFFVCVSSSVFFRRFIFLLIGFDKNLFELRPRGETMSRFNFLQNE